MSNVRCQTTPFRGALLLASMFPFLLVGAASPAITMNRTPDTVRAKEIADMKWGMFVCWSFSTFSGQEWTPGVTTISLFKATGCDADQWARTAKEAGMGYILFLTKHHDGFCLWDTKTTDRKVTKTALGRDVLAEVKKACDKHGIKLALYFSEGEWAWPDKPGGGRFDNNGGYNPELKKARLKELLTNYGPIEYIWFDHAVGDGGLSHEETDKWVANCLPGYNHGTPAGRIRLGEMGHPSPLDDVSGAGYNTHATGYKGYIAAEFTYPILPPHQGGAMWFYSLPQHDNLSLPAVQLIRGEITIPTPLKGTMTASGTWSQPGFEADKANDDDPSTRWGGPENSRAGWLQITLDAPHTVRQDCRPAAIWLARIPPRCLTPFPDRGRGQEAARPHGVP